MAFVGYNITAESSYPTPFSGNPLLPLILLSMAGQKHAPRTTTDIQEEYDYIIIGAGTAGSVVASRLSEEHCVRILLLEAGISPPKITDIPGIYNYLAPTELSWRFKTTPLRFTGEGTPQRSVTLNAGKVIGGSSIINGLQNIRGHKKDFDKWAEQGATGWSYEEVLPYFKKLENNVDLEYLVNGYHGVGGPVTISKPPYTSELKLAVDKAARQMGYNFTDANGPIQTGFYDLQATMKDGQRSSVAKGYLAPIDHRENLDIVTEAYVTKILIDDTGTLATAVEFDFEGRTREVKATKEVILSAGAINSPKILILSCIGPKDELERLDIPVTVDLPVGENLQEQWGVLSIFELSPKIKEFKEKLIATENIWRYIRTKSGPLASLSGVSTLAFLSQFGNPPPVEYPDYELYFIEGIEEFLNPFQLQDDYLRTIYKPSEHQAYFFCLSQVLHPKGRGSVTLNSSDPYAPPIINVEYFQRDDIETVVAGMKTCEAFGDSEPLKRIGSKPLITVVPECEEFMGDDDEYFRCIAKAVFITSSHQAGTNKMGAVDDPTTVVDPQLRLKGSIKNLRVVDASVIPSLTSGNFIPTIMIAEKASDMIKESIYCPVK